MLFDSVACADIFVLLPIRKTIGVFVFAWIYFFCWFHFLIVLVANLPFHSGSWDISLTVGPIANCLRGSSPVMEASRSTHWNVESEFMVTLRWECEWVCRHSWHKSLTGSSSLMNIMCYVVSSEILRIANLFFVLFSAIYNERFVTRRSRSSPE